MTHREKFQKQHSAKEWIHIVDSAIFQSAIDCAMLEFQREFGVVSDMATAAANEWRRQGGKRIIEILEQLALPPAKTPPAVTGQQLDYKMK